MPPRDATFETDLLAHDLGRTVQLNGGGNPQINGIPIPGIKRDLVRARFGREVPIVVQLQASAIVVVTIKYLVGEAWFTRTVSAGPRLASLRLTARAVFASAQYSGLTSDVVTVSGSASPGGDVNPLGELVPSWSLNETLGASGTSYTGAGTLLAVSGSIETLGGATALWLFLFDSSTGPAGTIIAPPAMIQGPGQFGFTDEQRAAIGFSSGVSWGLSTTQDVFTQAAGAVARVDVKVGT